MPKISIITPTKNREHHLPAIWDCVQKQSIQDVEWLISDDSPTPSSFLTGVARGNKNVRYLHDSKPLTIGAKRNLLVKEAKGDIIVHFDDDDYYAPGYIEAMLTLMANRNADIVKLFGFFLYHQRSGAYAYLDLEHGFPLHHVLHPQSDRIHFGQKSIGQFEEWGYGFSFVYARKVWEAQPFPDQDHGEDQVFANAAIRRFNEAGMQDNQFLMLHVIHDSNTSIVYPQQLLPSDFGQAYFPGFTPPASAKPAAGGP